MIFGNDKRLKEAFFRIREEMDGIRAELSQMREELSYLTDSVEAVLGHLEEQKQEESAKRCAKSSADVPRNAPNFTERFIKKGQDVPNFDFGTSEEVSAHFPPKSGELAPKDDFSIGNRGVSALRQQIGNTQATDPSPSSFQNSIPPELSGSSGHLQENVERLKKVLQASFKSLTKQEFVIFSTLYQMEEELKRPVSYSELAIRANLTPNSLRDYISKLIVKKVPIIKEKHNNKQILLKIAPELRNIETLGNLIRLVEE